MDTTLDATLRDSSRGKSDARKVRQAGKLPGVVYGGGAAATPIAIDPTALTTIFRKTQDRNTIVHIDLDGEKVPCLVRDVQRHPLTREILHIDFYKLEPGQEVVVRVPLTTIGRPKGFILGGRMRVLAREVPVRCAWDKIPSGLTHDVSKLNIDDFVKLSEIATPEGVEADYEHDFNVLTVYGKRAAPVDILDEDDQSGEGEGEGEGSEAETEAE